MTLTWNVTVYLKSGNRVDCQMAERTPLIDATGTGWVLVPVIGGALNVRLSEAEAVLYEKAEEE